MSVALRVARPAARRRARLGVIGWFSVAAGILAAVALGALVFNLLTLHRLGEARSALADRVDPAIASAYRLDAALVNEETGVRGYLLRRDRALLAAYRRGRAVKADLIGPRDRLVAERDLPGLRADLARLRAHETAWRMGFAEPAVARVRAGETAPGRAAVAAGQARFDAVGAAVASLQADLRTARARARDRLRVNAGLVTAAVWTGSGLLLLSLALAAWALRRQVIAPIGALAASVRRVAGGAYDTRVRGEGAREIEDLGRDTDTMRARIVEELHELERAGGAAPPVRGPPALQRRARAARLRRLPRPPGAAAQGGELLPDARAPLRRPARRARRPVHPLRGRRRPAHAGPHQRPARLLARVGRVARPHQDVDLGALLDRARANLAARIEETGAVVEAGELPHVEGDPGLLALVLQNLIGNALKFRGEERPHVRVAARRDGAMWELCVADNGIGIDAEYAERIFVIFQRLHTRTTYEGTGIGLAMCRKIVEYHGGRIWLDTGAPGPGTTFRFTLPAIEETTT